jgi:hypothetical protein
MNCHAVRAILDLLAEGRLAPRRDAAARAHLASCADCRALAAPAPVPAPSAKLPKALAAKLSAALKSERPIAPPPAPSLALWPSDLPGLAVAAAGLAVAALIAGWSGAPSQAYDAGGEVAAWRNP